MQFVSEWVSVCGMAGLLVYLIRFHYTHFINALVRFFEWIFRFFTLSFSLSWYFIFMVLKLSTYNIHKQCQAHRWLRLLVWRAHFSYSCLCIQIVMCEHVANALLRRNQNYRAIMKLEKQNKSSNNKNWNE